MEIERRCFTADLARNAGSGLSLAYEAGRSVVNLELPTAAGTPLGGTSLQGHVTDAGTGGSSTR